MLRLEISTLYVCWLPCQMGERKEMCMLEFFPSTETAE